MPHGSTETHIRQVFALTQRNTPRTDLLQKKVGEPAKANLKKALFSRYVGAKVIPHFLYGTDRDDRYRKSLLNKDVIAREAARLVAPADDPGPPIDPDPTASGSVSIPAAPSIAWRQAFYLFWNAVGPARKEIILRIGRSAENNLENAEVFLAAIALLERIDGMVERGEVAAAFLTARHKLEEGFTFTSSRYLALGLRLCSDPAQIEQLITKYGMHCSSRLIDSIRQKSAQMLDPAVSLEEPLGEGNAASEPTAETFAGELPAIYELTNRDVDWTDPARATLWAALERPIRTLEALNQAPEDGTVVVKLDDVSKEKGIATPDLSDLSDMLAEGISVIVVVDDDHPSRPSLAEIAGLRLAADMADARTMLGDSRGPLLVCNGVAPVPASMFTALAVSDPDPAPLPVHLEIMILNSPSEWGSGRPEHTAIPSWTSYLCGIYTSVATQGWDLLSISGGDPVDAAAKLDEQTSSLLRLFTTDRSPASQEPLSAASVTVRLDDEDSAPAMPGTYTLDLPAGVTGREVAEKLSALAKRETLTNDVPVVIQSPDFTYDVDYAAEIIRRYYIYTQQLPVAVRGLRIRSDDARPDFSEPDRDNGLFRAAPLGLSCIGLDMAVARLREWGARPAGQCVVVFNPAAAAWAGGRQKIRGNWRAVLDRVAADSETLHDIFTSAHRDLGGAITTYERGSHRSPAPQAGVHVKTVLPLPFQIYLCAQEAARQQMAAALAVGNEAGEGPAADANKALCAILSGAGLRTLLSDGHGIEIRKFLIALAPSLWTRGALNVAHGRALLELAETCGLQTTYARALAPAVLAHCEQDLGWIRPSFQYLRKFLEGPQVMPIMFAGLARKTNSQQRVRYLNRMSQQIAEACDAEDLELTLSLLDEVMGKNLIEARDALQVFGRRFLAASGPVPTSPLPRSGLRPSDCIALAEVETHLHAALNTGTRDAALAALRQIGEEDGTLPRAIETIRLQSAEISRLKITSEEWRYPLFADYNDTLVMAAILGDTDELRNLGVGSETLSDDRASEEMVVEYDHHRASDGYLRRAVGRMVLGDATDLTRIFAGWAQAEGIRPITFVAPPGGSSSIGDREESRYDLTDLFEGFAQEFPPGRATVHNSSSAAEAPLISVVITTFNADPTLLRLSITSILAQSWPSIEILLIDDNSSPDFRETTGNLATLDPRIHFRATTSNGGPYLARNLALEEARGSFIAIQDADDYSHPDRFARQIARLQARPEAFASEAGHMRFDRNGRPQFLRNLHIVDDGPMSTMFRREVFDILGPFAATRSRGDVEYRERIRQAYGPRAFDRTPCPMVFCFGAPGTLSQRVVRQTGDALKAFRHTFGQRRWISESTGRPVPVGTLTIPTGLRP